MKGFFCDIFLAINLVGERMLKVNKQSRGFMYYTRSKSAIKAQKNLYYEPFVVFNFVLVTFNFDLLIFDII